MRSRARANFIAWTIERVLAVGLIVAILFDFLNVVGRYLTGFTLTGLEEVEVYLLIWIAFLNAASGELAT